MVNEVDKNRYTSAFKTAVRKDFHSEDQVGIEDSSQGYDYIVMYLIKCGDGGFVSVVLLAKPASPIVTEFTALT